MTDDDAFARRVEAHRDRLAAADEASEAARQRCLAKCCEVSQFSAAFLEEMNRRGVSPPVRWTAPVPPPRRDTPPTAEPRGALGRLFRRGHAPRKDPAWKDGEVRGWIVLEAWKSGGFESTTGTAVPAPDATTSAAALVLREDGSWYMGSVQPGSAKLWRAELEVYATGAPNPWLIRWKSDAITAFFERRDLFADWDLLKYLSELAWDPTEALAQIAATSPRAKS